ADRGRFGAGQKGLVEGLRARGRRELAVQRVDVHEADALRDVEGQAGAAGEPLRPTGWLSSKPTQTTVNSSGVKPTNHASRRSLVVPVLPAASSVKPALRAPAAVPSFSTLRIMLVTRTVVSGRAIVRPSLDDFFVTSLPPLRMRPMCRRGRTTPPLGKSV